MSVPYIDCVVIGAGVVGLAVARSLAHSGRETAVLEAAQAIGTGISSRNSAVIHAGLYYPKDSLKARLCVEGRDLLYDYCAMRGIAVNRCGKFIVATSEGQCGQLAAIQAAARLNGVGDVRLGGSLVVGSPVRGLRRASGALRLTVGAQNTDEVDAGLVVNCTGLDAQTLARHVEGIAADAIPTPFYAKGNYFGIEGRVPFKRLIYPVPETAGLGVHLTLDLAGRARFGPDVEWVEEPEYRVNPDRAQAFYSAIRDYWPALPDGALQPDYAGVRPKLQGPGGAFQDFVIQGPDAHGIEGLVNLYGIESPGLTASLAIGEHVIRQYC